MKQRDIPLSFSLSPARARSLLSPRRVPRGCRVRGPLCRAASLPERAPPGTGTVTGPSYCKVTYKVRVRGKSRVKVGDKPKVNDGGIRQGDGGKSRAAAGNKVNDC